MESKTQINKVVSMRTLVTRALTGLPINARTHQLYELDTEDEDNEQIIIDEFSDKMDVMELQIQAREQLETAKKENGQLQAQLKQEVENLRKENEQLKKGGIKNETSSPNPPSQNPSES